MISQDVVESDNPKRQYCLGYRYIQVLLLCLALASAIFCRSNVGITLVNITDAEENAHAYHWSFTEKQLVLSSFSWGYIVTQIAGGLISQKYGTRNIILISLLVSSVLSIITPKCIELGEWKAFCAVNALKGIFQGMLIPSVFGHLAKWSPASEKNLMGTVMSSGYHLGSILGTGLSGVIITSEMRWQGVFFISGSIGIAWSLLWMIFASNSPNDSRFITKEEKEKIQENSQNKCCQTKEIPWRSIMTSPPFLSLVLVTCCLTFGINGSGIAIYFHDVLKFDIRDNAFYSMLPQVLSLLMSFVFLAVAQFLQTSRNMSLTKLRKSYSVIACGVPTIVYFCLGFLYRYPIAAAVLIMLKAGSSASYDIAFWFNVLDLSPNYSAILFGILNFCNNFFEIVSPLVIAAIIGEDGSDPWKWQIVFLMNVAIIPVGCVVYLIFGRTKCQKWNLKE